ncbi:Cof-type HAD-IIB family hydrolase [Bacillus carboniphilus]|uniref:Cof-type HAD-IIB family hydrolase n=1 Tax=Bacillus carboniphilus TaxID=86663 RepID=A0ABY9JWW4_9BACI|nr:Cof-type HAD-IIB family hydrolase [Bacillus carboniphilus]WLR43289.1 Cof-type HAD-IIB family hydrolase [Bacillus carboniphilus]
MSEKVIFFDIDGTLLDHEKKIPNSTKYAIDKLKENGHYVAISTGRAPFMFKDIRSELGIDSFVSFNGQFVVFEGNIAYENPLSERKLESLRLYSEERNHPLVFMSHEDMKATVYDHKYIHESMGSLLFNHPEHLPHYHQSSSIYQTLLFCQDGEELEYRRDYQDFHIIRWHEYATDILPIGGSKAEGIKHLLERLKIPKEDVYAFGDGLNDLEMIEFVGNGVAMGNAVLELKNVADMVTKPVDEHGIEYGLKKLGLIE